MKNPKIIKNIFYPIYLILFFGWIIFIFVQKSEWRYSMSIYDSNSWFLSKIFDNFSKKNKEIENQKYEKVENTWLLDKKIDIKSEDYFANIPKTENLQKNNQTNEILPWFELNTQNIDYSTDDINNIYNIQKIQNDLTIDQMKDIMSSTNFFSSYNISNFEYIYNTTKDPKILASIVKLYLLEFNYNKAYFYFTKFGNDYYKYLEWKDILSVLTNSDLVTNVWGQDMIRKTFFALQKKWKLVSDDVLFYEWLLSFANMDIQKAQSYWNSIKDSKYKVFQNKINEIIKSWYLQPDLPNYYLIWLLDIEILKLWYFKVAQKISLEILNQNINYILPYQILAYSHFVMNDRTIAWDYFNELKKKDIKNSDKYNFLLGVCYFWQWKYTDSIIFLKQASSTEYVSDIFRYLAIWYDKIWDDTNFLITYKNILWLDELNSSDFLFFFEKVFFMPILDQKDWKIYKENKNLVIQSINLCFQKMKDSDLAVCNYGQIWVLLAENKKDSVWQKLLYLTKEFNKSYLWEILWDWYISQWEKEKAKESYIKAISISSNDKKKEYTKQKLINTIIY